MEMVGSNEAENKMWGSNEVEKNINVELIIGHLHNEHMRNHHILNCEQMIYIYIVYELDVAATLILVTSSGCYRYETPLLEYSKWSANSNNKQSAENNKRKNKQAEAEKKVVTTATKI